MSKLIKFVLFLYVIVLIGFPIFKNAQASELGETYVFFERMQVGQQTDLIILITPSTNFDAGSDIRMSFLNDIGGWCQNTAAMDIEGIGSSPVDMGTWTIDAELPGATLSAMCYPGDPILETYDYILVSDIGALDAGVGYGFVISKTADFLTSSIDGPQSLEIVLSDSLHSESILVDFNLISSDKVVVSADVAGVSTITCGISDSEISFPTLSKGTNYSTVHHTISISTSDSANGYYWAVYGEGDGTEAGLWKGTIPTSLIPSTGSSTINLVSNHGFGLVVTSPFGDIPSDFLDSTPGVFGAVDSGYVKARMILYSHAPQIGVLTSTITMGAKAGTASEVGSYSETLTYVCGGFF